MTTDPESPVTVATAASEMEAGIMVGALDVEGIKARAVGDFTSGFRAEAPGSVAVLVRQEDAEQARKILRAAHPENVV